MKTRLKYIMSAAVIFASFQSFAQTTATLQTIPSRMPVLIKTAGLTPIGQMDTTAQLNFTIGLQLENQQAFNQLLQNLYDPQSPDYRQFLSHQQAVQEFCPTAAAYQTVVSFVESHGLSVTRQYADHMLVDVKGSVAAIQRALHIKMLLYKHPTENRDFYAPDAAPSVDLSTPIQAITGLSNFYIPRPALVTSPANGKTAYPTISSGSINGWYDGNDLRAAYLQNVSLSGHGQKVGLLQFVQYDTSNGTDDGGFYPHDITEYDSLSGLPQVPIEVDNIDGQSETPNPETVDEFSVDIEMANAMAPGMDSIIVYYGLAPDEILDAMLANTSVKQFSASWILWPDGNTPGQLKIMAAQGQTFFNASGDELVWASAWPGPNDPRQYDEPPFAGYATDTGATIVGGTQLSTNGPGGSYASETVWNAGNDVRGSGGGVEEGTFAENIPTYQLGLNGVNGASKSYRNGPDVAMVATNIMEVSKNGQVFGSGGTSFASPLWAGYMALVNQQAAANGYVHGVGFINPLLYSLGEGNSYNSCFNDVQSGNNYYTSSSGTIGYSAGSGYDLCTGWGSPNGQTLINFLSNPVWHGTVTLSSSYSIPSGQSLIIEPGTTVQLGSGVSINASGVINAVGTAAEPITFTSTGGTSPGSWGSIVFSGSGADKSSLKYCDIDYATDVEVNNTSNVTIANCSISNSSGTGISVYNTSNFLAQYDSVAVTNYNTAISIDGGSNNNCSYNVAYNPGSPGDGIGIEYNASSGTVGENDVDYVGSGILAENGASPNADQYPPNNKNNRVTHCAYGLNVYSSSVCDFGNPPGIAYIDNSVHNNTVYDAAVGYFGGTATLYANADYWGSSPSYYTGSGSTGDFYMPLSSDPWNNWPLPSGSQQTPEGKVRLTDAAAKSDDPHIQVQTPSTPPSWLDSLFAGADLRQSGQFTAATNYFISFISQHRDNPAGYVELYGCANDTTISGIVNFFKTQQAGTPNIAQLLLGHLYQMENQPKLAMQVNDKIVSSYPNTALAVNAEISNMLIDLYDDNDLHGAEALLDSIKADSSLIAPMDLYAAEQALAVHGGPAISGSRKAISVESTSLPKSFGLSQNYPNPFNPTTRIDYQLPNDAHVTIKVYDVLGREVATLVDGQQTAGYHEVSFNGASLASGIYFYKMTAGNYTAVKKLMLLK